MTDKQTEREIVAAEKEVAEDPAAVQATAPAQAAASGRYHRLTPEEIGAPAPFDTTGGVVPAYGVRAGVAAPEVKKSDRRVRVLYGGPSSSFVVDVDGSRVETNRFEPMELPESVLDWLQKTYPTHSWGIVRD